jgi:hypothetical protein
MTRWIVAAVLLATAAAWGQNYTLSFSKRSDRLTWRPTFPSWNFSTPVTLSTAGDSTSMLRLNASMSLSAILDQRDGRNNWTETASIRTSVLYPILGPRASMGITASMSSRNATLLNQKTRSQTINFRFQYQPLSGTDGIFEDLRFDVVPGVITAQRANPVNPDSVIQETGLQYTGSMRTSPDFTLFGERLTTSLSLGKTDNTLETNKSRSENLRASSAYTFPGDVRTNLSFSESRSETGVTRSSADTAKAELSKRRNRSLSASLTTKIHGFNVRSSQSWSEGLNTNTANADNDPRNRFYARDRESERWNLSGSVDGRIAEQLTGSVRLSWAATDERRLPVPLPTGGVYRDPTDDREDRNLQVGGSLDWQPAEGHSLQISASARMNRIDNPGASVQDRDSHNQVASLTYRGRRDGGMRYDVSLSSTRSHRVNLDATRSGDNQRSSELRLSTNTSYSRMAAQLSHNFEISARRSIFDFDRRINTRIVSRRSNIRRGWSMRHTIRRSLFETLQLNTTYSYSADDFGTLLVGNGSQIVEQDNNDHRISLAMNYRPNAATSFGVNYSYRLDRRWSFFYARDSIDRELSFRNAHRNLAVNMQYKPTGYTGLTARASRSHQRSGTFDDLSLTISRKF